jgi:hypothetical protein
VAFFFQRVVGHEAALHSCDENGVLASVVASSPRGSEKGARDGAIADALATDAPSGGMSDSPHHDGSSAAADASGCGFYHERTVMTATQVIAEEVSYRSGAYQVNGIVCRPNDARRHAPGYGDYRLLCYH